MLLQPRKASCWHVLLLLALIASSADASPYLITIPSSAFAKPLAVRLVKPAAAAASNATATTAQAGSSSAVTAQAGAPRVQQITLSHKPYAATPATAVNFTMYPAAATRAASPLPVLFLLNGANVESRHYSTIASHLAAHGYTFIASDYYRKLPAGIPGPSLNAICPKGYLLGASAALIQTLLNHTDTADAAVLARQGLQDLRRRGIVVVGHSLGGAAALDIMDEACVASEAAGIPGLTSCEAYQPSLRNSSSSSEGKTSCRATRPAAATAAVVMEAGSKQASQQQQKQKQQKGLIVGAVVFEGYRTQQDTAAAAATAAASRASTAAAAPAKPANMSLQPTGVAIPPGTFVLYLSGQYAAHKLQAAYNNSNASRCSCISLAEFPGLNHYGMNDWQGPNSHQITPCGIKASSDPVNFNVSNSFQNGQLSKMTELVDGFIRASLGDAAAQQQLLQQAAAAGATNSSSNAVMGSRVSISVGDSRSRSSSSVRSVRARMLLSGGVPSGASFGSVSRGMLLQQQQQQQQPRVGYSLQLKPQCFV